MCRGAGDLSCTKHFRRTQIGINGVPKTLLLCTAHYEFLETETREAVETPPAPKQPAPQSNRMFCFLADGTPVPWPTVIQEMRDWGVEGLPGHGNILPDRLILYYVQRKADEATDSGTTREPA